LFSIPSINCIASIFLSVSELLQVLTINHLSLWMPKVDILGFTITEATVGLGFRELVTNVLSLIIVLELIRAFMRMSTF